VPSLDEIPSEALPPVVDLRPQYDSSEDYREETRTQVAEKGWEEPVRESNVMPQEPAAAPTTERARPTPAAQTRNALRRGAPGEATSKIDRIMSRSGTGFKGLCPVILRDERNLAEASEQYYSTYKGKTYYFSSEAAQARFDGHPERYAPANGGNDIVMLVRHDKILEGSLDYAGWYKDQLYLFSSPENLETFTREPRMYVAE
jgi:YHS domain-containing protein